ncbi:MAG: aldo/keto reductase [Proteobacteria bacterium]|nr:aldo/keto reductase [Pseudomonadota bacterium]
MDRPAVPRVFLADGVDVPALGLGTWHMGESAASRRHEVDALREGITRGLALVDTAEMYGDGGAEEVVAEALEGVREQCFVVSKVLPQHASARGVASACERSLARLRIDRLDLYLLHWRGSVPLAETVRAFEALRRDGRIARWGVSNFDVDDIEELFALPEGRHCTVNQVLYHLGERGIEWALADLCRRHRISIMAYSPFDEGRLLGHRALRAVAARIHATPAQVALAWLVARKVIAIPKAAHIRHVDDNAAAAALHLSDATLRELDNAFPPPSRATPLAMI